jgi:DNA polymerase elongation subunit (family B)/histone H3/H4
MISSANFESVVPPRTCEPIVRANPTDPILFRPTPVLDEDVWSRGSARYDLRMYGTLLNGAKACVHLSDVFPYFEYDISAHNPTAWRLNQAQIERDPIATARLEGEGKARMESIILEICGRTEHTSARVAWKFPLQGFTLEKSMYVQLFFSSMRARNECLRAVKSYVMSPRGTELPLLHRYPNILAHDDTGFNNPAYFNALARDAHFNTTDWNEIIPTSMEKRERYGASYYEFSVPLANIRAARAPADAAEALARAHDRTILESWDIETMFESESGDPPTTQNDYTITTISLVYSYHWQTIPIACYVLSIYNSNPPDRAALVRAGMGEMPVTFIKCADECDLILTRARISARMMPDMRIAFNGANFDWPLYNEKVRRFGKCFEVLPLLDMSFTPWDSADDDKQWEKYSRKFVSIDVKINAENGHKCAQVGQLAGSIDLDIMPTMRRIHKNEEVKFAQSLNVYLRKANLSEKIDVYFKRMLRILQRARDLASPAIPRKCHCDSRDTCAFCANTERTRVRDIDYAVVDESQPMSQWVYTDKLRDPRLTSCCACGARPINEGDVEKINTYCGIDSVRPLQLINKLNILGDHREMAGTTYTALVDAFFRADGMRVVNFTGSFAREFNIAISAHSPERPRVHYQGAHVFSPKLGFCCNARGRRRPVTALDFNSLYPSIMMAYNISPDMLVTSEEAAAQLTTAGYDLHRIEPFDYDILSEDKRAAVVAHASAHGWAVRHNGVLAPHATLATTPPDARPITSRVNAEGAEVRGRPANEREYIGIFPHALRILLNSRKATRAVQAKRLARLVEILERVSGGAHVEPDVLDLDGQVERIFAHPTTPDLAPTDAERFEASNLIVDYKMLNSKQLAYKVLMNTYYGQMGSNKSVCYTLVGAAGVTAAGRYNILRVAALLRGLGYIIAYGDTDSVYTIAPDSTYTAIDAKWDAHEYPSLEDYWGDMVVAAREDIERLRAIVSSYLRSDNGTQFLAMGYEEVGMPALFLGKKKYLLRPHVKGVTFRARPMVRGIETVKQGRAQIVRTLGNAIIEELLAISETTNPHAIVESKIRAFYAGIGEAPQEAEAATRVAFGVNEFIQFGRYKPAKENKATLRFVERMRERFAQLSQVDPVAAGQCVPPEPGDKFPYVIVARDAEVSLSGHCVQFKVGDKMEYPSMVIGGGQRIDYNHYMNGALISVFARFVSCDPQFDPSRDPSPEARAKWAQILTADGSVPDDYDYTVYDDYRQQRAVRALSEVCAQIAPTNTARIHATARVQRSAVGALRDVVSRAAEACGFYLDAPVVRLIVHDRMREICAGAPGSRISEDTVEAMANLICEVACEQARDSMISEAEATANYAARMLEVFTPETLAARYSGTMYTQLVVKPLSDVRAHVLSAIKMDFAARIVALYRAKRFDETLSGIVANSIDEGLKGKAALMPAVGMNITFGKATLELLHELGKLMIKYADADVALRRAAKMREQFGTN